MFNKIGMIAGLLVTLFTLGGFAISADKHYAKTASVDTLEFRLENKIINDRMNTLQDQMWKIEDRWSAEFKEEFERHADDLDELIQYMPPRDRDQYRKLKAEYELLMLELDVMMTEEQKTND
jgi:hypothetical protein